MGIKFKGIKVDDGVIIDGHHRYLASLLAGSQLEIIPSGKTSATKITEWHVVDFDVDDWDTEAKILMLNELDAIYNNVSIEDIIKLIE